jgi:UDP-glucose 4-epimerase
MKYIIFGGSGFIGSNIVELIQRQSGAECFAPGSQQCDLCDPVKTNKILSPILKDAVVIYAAGIPRLRANGFDALTDNIAMIYNLIEQFQQTPPKQVIFLSTVEVYGIPVELSITEATPLVPETLYGVGKVTAELLLQRWHRQSNIPLAILRLPGIYGPGDKGRGFVGALIQTIKNNGEFNLIGGGKELRDFVFVKDVARAVLQLSRSDFSQLTLNLATGTSIPVFDIMQKIFARFGPCTLNEKPQTQRICHLKFDTTALRVQLPELKMTVIEEGLKYYENAS